MLKGVKMIVVYVWKYFFVKRERESIIILPYGHIIHSDCYVSSLRQNRFTCPLCRKTMIMGDMLQMMISEYDRIIYTLEYDRNVNTQIICNDCDFKGEVIFHTFGLKCWRSNIIYTKGIEIFVYIILLFKCFKH